MVDAVSTGLSATDKAAVLGQVMALIVLAGGVALVGDLCSAIAGFVSEAQSQVATDYVHSLLHAKNCRKRHPQGTDATQWFICSPV